MKKLVKASKSNSVVKVRYCSGLDSPQPILESFTVTGGDPKEALMGAINNLNFGDLGFDFNEPDEFSFDELLDQLIYENGESIENDYIFSLDINSKNYINNIKPEEQYRTSDLL